LAENINQARQLIISKHISQTGVNARQVRDELKKAAKVMTNPRGFFVYKVEKTFPQPTNKEHIMSKSGINFP
jgi:hypothetical protein